MKVKVVNCEECLHFAWKENDKWEKRPCFDSVATCAKNHTPRFIMPDDFPSHAQRPWGYRRACADFNERLIDHAKAQQKLN